MKLLLLAFGKPLFGAAAGFVFGYPSPSEPALLEVFPNEAIPPEAGVLVDPPKVVPKIERIERIAPPDEVEEAPVRRARPPQVRRPRPVAPKVPRPAQP